MIETLRWVAVCALAFAVGGGIGVLAALWQEKLRRARDARKAKQQTELRALLTAQRLNAAFMETRRAMWEEALRQHQRPGAL